jgi:hypothetical protein
MEPRNPFQGIDSASLCSLCCAGNLRPAMGARNQVGIGLSYRPASLCSLATQFQTWFLESIPRPIAGLKIPTLEFLQSMGDRNRVRIVLSYRPARLHRLAASIPWNGLLGTLKGLKIPYVAPKNFTNSGSEQSTVVSA